MPMRRAHFWVLGMLVVTVIAFWPGYFSKLGGAKYHIHVHAIGAMLWTVLVAGQSWSIAAGQRSLHRTAGLASFVAFPLFLVGGMLSYQAEAVPLVATPDSPDNLFIGPFGFFDGLANIGFAVLVHGGLKYRRNVQLHARYMVATLLFLVCPLLFRVLPRLLPILDSSTPETAARFAYAMAAGNLGALLLAVWLWWQAPKWGRPFAIAGGFIVAQQVLFATVGTTAAWTDLFAQIVGINTGLLVIATLAASAAILWHGWVAGNAPVRQAAAAAE
ncbi:MAG: hypothetical protein U9R07_12605 [Pseudomonadota bacterium]|nr:hypothetical protein [Pseudomonadota bacterium]